MSLYVSGVDIPVIIINDEDRDVYGHTNGESVTINIAKHKSEESVLATLIHELAHVFFNHIHKDLCYEEEEFEACYATELWFQMELNRAPLRKRSPRYKKELQEMNKHSYYQGAQRYKEFCTIMKTNNVSRNELIALSKRIWSSRP